MNDVSWHSVDVNEVIRKLDSSITDGLSEKEAQQRLEKFGPNALHEEEGLKIPKLILDQFKDAFVIMLLVAAVLSYIVGEPLDAVMIAIIVVLSAAIGFVQEYRAERAMEALKGMAAPMASLIRDGSVTAIPASLVVPGDIVFLEAGNVVPADLRLIETHRLQIEEAALTGESNPVEKIVEPLPQTLFHLSGMAEQ